jgi:hypothetical protein
MASTVPVGEGREVRRLTTTEMEKDVKRDCVSSATENSQEAMVVNAFSTLKLLTMLKRKSHLELQLKDELYLKMGSSVLALVA